MDKLKPCPFCGGEAQSVRRKNSHIVGCTECTASVEDCAGTNENGEEVAVKRWNTRPPEAQLKELLVEARDGLEYWNPDIYNPKINLVFKELIKKITNTLESKMKRIDYETFDGGFGSFGCEDITLLENGCIKCEGYHNHITEETRTLIINPNKYASIELPKEIKS